MKIKDVIRIINAWKEDCETAEGRQQETSTTNEKTSINMQSGTNSAKGRTTLQKQKH